MHIRSIRGLYFFCGLNQESRSDEHTQLANLIAVTLYQSIYLSIYLSSIYLSVCLSVSVCPSISISIYSFIFISLSHQGPPLSLISIYLSIYLSLSNISFSRATATKRKGKSLRINEHM